MNEVGSSVITDMNSDLHECVFAIFKVKSRHVVFRY